MNKLYDMKKVMEEARMSETGKEKNNYNGGEKKRNTKIISTLRKTPSRSSM